MRQHAGAPTPRRACAGEHTTYTAALRRAARSLYGILPSFTRGTPRFIVVRWCRVEHRSRRRVGSSLHGVFVFRPCQTRGTRAGPPGVAGWIIHHCAPHPKGPPANAGGLFPFPPNGPPWAAGPTDRVQQYFPKRLKISCFRSSVYCIRLYAVV